MTLREARGCLRSHRKAGRSTPKSRPRHQSGPPGKVLVHTWPQRRVGGRAEEGKGGEGAGRSRSGTARIGCSEGRRRPSLEGREPSSQIPGSRLAGRAAQLRCARPGGTGLEKDQMRARGFPPGTSKETLLPNPTGTVAGAWGPRAGSPGAWGC